ncbi:MAG: hypothetical protein JO142_07190 [Burkholderiales bacterium]|nr:hypothetical protein [Burkholderiales bacterium]
MRSSQRVVPFVAIEAMINIFRQTLAVSLIAPCLVLFVGCASPLSDKPYKNYGDLVVGELSAGMSAKEVDVVVERNKKYLISDNLDVVGNGLVYYAYLNHYAPQDVMKSSPPGTPLRHLAYWVNAWEGVRGHLYLIYDAQRKQLRGWVNTGSEFSRDAFAHEKLTAKLHAPQEGRNAMTHAEVYAQIGHPSYIMPTPKVQSLDLYENCFWYTESPPLPYTYPNIEVYTYEMADGQLRHVYLVYGLDHLLARGYDHAWEERVRYLVEKSTVIAGHDQTRP